MDYLVDYYKLCIKIFSLNFLIETVLVYTKYLRDCDDDTKYEIFECGKGNFRNFTSLKY